MKQELKELIGTGWNFPPTFNKALNTEQNQVSWVATVDGVEEIKQSIRLILNTSLGERIYYPDFGCNLNDYMFEELDNSLGYNLLDVCLQSIKKYEKRISVYHSRFELEPNQGLIRFYFDFAINQSSVRETLQYDFETKGSE